MWGQKGGGGAQTYHCPPIKKVGGGPHAPLPPPPTPASYASDIYMYICVCVCVCVCLNVTIWMK